MDKILVGEPIYSGMSDQVYFNRCNLWDQVCKDVLHGLYDVRRMVTGHRNIRSARDLMVTKAIDGDATHLFMMDSDIEVPPDIIEKLSCLNVPIVGGLVHTDEGTPTVFESAGEGEVPWLDHPRKGVFECAAVGAGCMMIKVEVLKAIKAKHRWAFTYDETERTMDVRFCRMAREEGFSVWCWPDVPCVQRRHY